MTTFDNTREALVAFDAGRMARAMAWETVNTVDDVVKAEEADRLALRAVQDAFHEDTKEFNSHESCRRADLDFMRRMTSKVTA